MLCFENWPLGGRDYSVGKMQGLLNEVFQKKLESCGVMFRQLTSNRQQCMFRLFWLESMVWFSFCPYFFGSSVVQLSVSAQSPPTSTPSILNP